MWARLLERSHWLFNAASQGDPVLQDGEELQESDG
mgnify:CR=1